jgi:hypothetical protein
MKKMDESLKKKIFFNEARIHKLFEKNKKVNNKVYDNSENKENKSYIYNKQKGKKQDICTLTEIKGNKDASSTSIFTQSNNNSYLTTTNQYKKKKKVMINHKQFNKKNMRFYNPLRNDDSSDLKNLNNYTNTVNNKSKKKKILGYICKNEKSNGKTKNNKRSRMVSQEKINSISRTIDISGLDISINSIKSSVNINQMFERFDENQRKKIEKIQKLKKIQEDEEKKINTHMPLISKKSKNINKKVKDDFLTRQKKYNDIKKNNDKKLRESVLKNEQEKINKNNYLLQKKVKESSSVSNNLNTSFISEISRCTRSMVDIEQNISKLLEWDNKRKEKIIKKQKEKNNELDKIKHVPEINKRSRSIANRRKNQKKELSIFDRLAKEDEVLKEKKRILEELYTPTFRPNLNLTFSKIDEDENIEDKKKRNKKNSVDSGKRSNILYFSKKNGINHGKRNIIDFSSVKGSETFEFGKIIVNRNVKIKPKKNKIEKKICDKENEINKNEDINNELRKIILNNMNKKAINRSFGNN